MEDKDSPLEVITEGFIWQEYKNGNCLRIVHSGTTTTHKVQRIYYDEDANTVHKETYEVTGSDAIANAHNMFKEWLLKEL